MYLKKTINFFGMKSMIFSLYFSLTPLVKLKTSPGRGSLQSATTISSLRNTVLWISLAIGRTCLLSAGARNRRCWREKVSAVRGVAAQHAGQFVCGSLHCDEREELESWEVDFHYREKGESKSALVKVRLCPRDSKR
jgi:hypothetical protein